MQFYTGDWLKDPCLSMCPPSTRGIWIDLLAAMHESDRSGIIVGTRNQIAQLCRCSVVDLDLALEHLQTTKTADVMVRNSIVTVVNRRMRKEAKTRESNRLRVSKHRHDKACNGSEMLHISEVSGQKQVTIPISRSLPKLEDVRFAAATAGCSMEEAEKFWNHFESSGWIDKNGNRVVNWRTKLAVWASNSRVVKSEVSKGSGSNTGNDFWKLSKQLEHVEGEIKLIESRASHTATGMIVESCDRERYRKLKQSRRQLKTNLGL